MATSFAWRGGIVFGFTAVLNANELWTVLDEIAQEAGVALFDVERPGSRTGVLRIFIAARRAPSAEREEAKKGVSLEDCVRMTRAIEHDERYEQILPDGCSLEVSSPGINRKLKRPEHYDTALGERVKLKLHRPLADEAAVEDAEPVKKAKRKGNDATLVCGQLVQVSDDVVEVQDEDRSKNVRIPRVDIAEGRVEFKF